MTVAGGAAAESGASKSKAIAMIGAGNMGQALGNLWAAAGHKVIFATRHPDELDDMVKTAGHGAEAVRRADIITLAVPYKAEPSIAKEHGEAMKGKVLVNVGNALAHRDGEIAEKAKAAGGTPVCEGGLENAREY